MSEHEQLGRTLEVLVPPFDAAPDGWEDVLRRAERDGRVRRDRRRRCRVLAVALATLGAVCAVVLVDPFGGDDKEGVLDRALAAVGDGAVLRVVRGLRSAGH